MRMRKEIRETFRRGNQQDLRTDENCGVRKLSGRRLR